MFVPVRSRCRMEHLEGQWKALVLRVSAVQWDCEGRRCIEPVQIGVCVCPGACTSLHSPTQQTPGICQSPAESLPSWCSDDRERQTIDKLESYQEVVSAVQKIKEGNGIVPARVGATLAKWSGKACPMR